MVKVRQDAITSKKKYEIFICPIKERINNTYNPSSPDELAHDTSVPQIKHWSLGSNGHDSK